MTQLLTITHILRVSDFFLLGVTVTQTSSLHVNACESIWIYHDEFSTWSLILMMLHCKCKQWQQGFPYIGLHVYVVSYAGNVTVHVTVHMTETTVRLAHVWLLLLGEGHRLDMRERWKSSLCTAVPHKKMDDLGFLLAVIMKIFCNHTVL